MSDTTQTKSARIATRLAFLAAGLPFAGWAPLVPVAKDNVGVSEAGLGLLLLCLGVGSLTAMPVTGWIAARSGARPMVMLGGIGIALLFPCLLLAGQPWLLGAALFLFGASLGTLDVSMNVHGSEIERIEKRPLMSGFHAMFSIGALLGAAIVTGALSVGLSSFAAALICSAATLLAMVLAAPGLMKAGGGSKDPFALPKGPVLLLAVLAAIAFLVEGALLDWGALLMIDRSLFAIEQAGLGYMAFSVTMVIGRLTGDRVVAAFGRFNTLFYGGVLVLGGIALIQLGAGQGAALAGFACVGLGAANLVPVLFSLAGQQTIVPAGHAIAAVTTTAYAGVLLGPAIVGLVAEQTSLPQAFWILAILMAVFPVAARRAVSIR